MLDARAPQTDSPRWLRVLAEEPALVVLLLAALLVLVVAAVYLRLRRAVRQARARGDLEDWLLGAEDALSGQLASARDRLQRALEHDPENHGARVLLAETLLALGEASAAHAHFLTLHGAFGVRGRRVELGLVRALVEAGRAADAADRLAALPRSDDVAALRLRLAVELAAGLPQAAMQTSERLAACAERPADALAARSASQRAVAMLDAVATAAAGSPRRIALASGLPGADLMERAERPAVASPAAAQVALQQLAAEVARAPYVCASCGTALARAVPQCPHCDARTAPRLREPGLHRELPSVSAVADEIEENDAHVRRLLERMLAGDTEARADLVAAGAHAVAIVFERALNDVGARAVLITVLQEMGSRVLGALFDAYERTRATAGGALSGVRAAAPDIVGLVVQSYGAAALPVLESRLDTDDHDLRKIVVDFYLGLDDVDELQNVLERYPPVEVIQRLNVTPAARLQAWLARVPERGLLAEVVLPNPMFVRDEDVLLAAAHAPSPAALLALLQRRGPSHDLATFAVGCLHDENLAAVAERLLREYGVSAADACLAGYLDLDRAPPARARARAVLAALGAAVVPKVCQCFGASPARLDDELVALLIAVGEPAVNELREAYTRRNLLERVGGRLVRRYNHPRNVIVKALARIGGASAHTALLALRGGETDPNLKLRLDQALQMTARTPVLPPAAPAGERAPGAPAEEAG